ncbi:hypothetical protein EAF00_004723 [Botryotinia globosa]|nr:hypothetical protein EAF00_004723 [Botryotinia globosa]
MLLLSHPVLSRSTSLDLPRISTINQFRQPWKPEISPKRDFLKDARIGTVCEEKASAEYRLESPGPYKQSQENSERQRLVDWRPQMNYTASFCRVSAPLYLVLNSHSLDFQDEFGWDVKQDLCNKFWENTEHNAGVSNNRLTNGPLNIDDNGALKSSGSYVLCCLSYCTYQVPDANLKLYHLETLKIQRGGSRVSTKSSHWELLLLPMSKDFDEPDSRIEIWDLGQL